MNPRAWIPLVPALTLVLATCDGGGSDGTGEGGSTPGKCTFPDDAVQMTYATFDGQKSRCPTDLEFAPVVLTIEGAITTTGPGSFSIDGCHPADGCAPMISTIAISGGMIDATIPDGAFVRATLAETGPSSDIFVCQGIQVLIQNLPDWNGLPNPVSTGSHVWLAAGDMLFWPDVGNPFTIDRELACGDPEDYLQDITYDLRFSTAGAEDQQAGQGETKSWTIAGGTQAGTYSVRNVRCASQCCHGGFCGYWIARTGD